MTGIVDDRRRSHGSRAADEPPGVDFEDGCVALRIQQLATSARVESHDG